MNLNLSVLPDYFLCLGSADMYVAHLCRERELHEHVVYQVLLLFFFSRNIIYDDCKISKQIFFLGLKSGSNSGISA